MAARMIRGRDWLDIVSSTSHSPQVFVSSLFAKQILREGGRECL